jgi:O-antigen/teichoic acid export membrane protein
VQSNFYWALAGNASYAALQWLMLMSMAKLGSPDMVGRYTLAVSIAAPVILFCNLQLRAIQVSDANNKYSLSDYLSLRLLTTTVALVVVAAISMRFGYSTELAWVIVAVGCAKAIESLSDILFGLMQKNDRLDYVARSQMLKGTLLLFAVSSAIYLSRRLVPGLVAMCAVWLVVLLVVDVRNVGRFPASRNIRLSKGIVGLRRLGSLAYTALPLGLVAMLMSLNWNVSRYFLERYRGETDVGYFAAMAYLPGAGIIAIDALAQSTISHLARHHLVNRSAYNRLVLRLLIIAGTFGATGILGAYFAGKTVLTLLYSPAYARQPVVFVWLMGAGCEIYLCGVLGVALTSARFLRGQVPIYLVVLITSVLSSSLLVPRFGQLGAAWSMFATTAVWLGLLSASAAYVMRQRVPVPITKDSREIAAASIPSVSSWQ